MATIYGGHRYIVYDKAFMAKIDKASDTGWASLSILAHEIGHHLNGDTNLLEHNPPTRAELRRNRENELAADEFSGNILAQLGATLKQAQAAMRAMPDVSNEETSTHPKRSRRLVAIEEGYNKGKAKAARTAPAPRRVQCVHQVACDHRLNCIHQVACAHQVACVHRTACVHPIVCQHPYWNGVRWLPTHPQGDAAHPFDIMHPFDTVHPFDVLHPFDTVHPYHTLHEFDYEGQR